MLSPLVVTLLPLTLGWTGWIVLGALFRGPPGRRWCPSPAGRSARELQCRRESSRSPSCCSQPGSSWSDGARLACARRAGGFSPSCAGSALQLAGEQPAVALGFGWIAMLVEGCAEPENAGWCACRLPRGRGPPARRRVST
jgi:hypothetical protein